MANNCLVTKLKSAVNNPELRTLDEIIIDVPTSEQTLHMRVGDSFHIKNIGHNQITVPGGQILNYGESAQINSANVMEIPGGSRLIIGNKSTLVLYEELFKTTGTVSDVCGMINCNTFATGRDGDLSILPHIEYYSFGIYGTNDGLYSVLENSKRTLAYITVASPDATTKEYITMSQLSEFTGLDLINFAGNACIGNMEDWVASARLAGRTSGTLTFYACSINTGIKVNNRSLSQIIAEDYPSELYKNLVLTWTADSISIG